jgi:hypothetical protein
MQSLNSERNSSRTHLLARASDMEDEEWTRLTNQHKVSAAGCLMQGKARQRGNEWVLPTLT